MTGRRKLGSERGRLIAMGAAAAVVLWLALPVAADDNFPSAGAYAGGLSADSSWADILKKPGVQAAFPMVQLENTYVSLPALCVDGGMLRAANSHAGTGVPLAAGSGSGQMRAPAAQSGYAALRADAFEGGDPFAVGPTALSEPAPGRVDPSQIAPSGYLVTVYQVNSWFTSMRTPLFQKLWVIPTCPGG
jgi:hypothetical protein